MARPLVVAVHPAGAAGRGGGEAGERARPAAAERRGSLLEASARESRDAEEKLEEGLHVALVETQKLRSALSLLETQRDEAIDNHKIGNESIRLSPS